MNRPRIGLTMLELVISLSLFSVVMVAVLQSMISATSYVEFDSARTDLETASIRFQSRVLNDFANAAWLYRYDNKAFQAYVDPVTKQRQPLFPAVSTDRTQIEFLKLRTSLAVDPVPKNQQYAYTNFQSPTTQAIDFSHYVDSSPTPLMVVNPNYRADPQWFVAAVWESYQAKLNFDDNQNPDNLRHFLYVVEPNSRGSNSLVRKYLNGYNGTPPPASAWTLDEVLIDEVKSVEFDTWNEDKNLNENQLRLVVVLEHQPQGPSAGNGTTVIRRIDFTASMRSINQE